LSRCRVKARARLGWTANPSFFARHDSGCGSRGTPVARSRFESELADVDLGEELSVEIGSFSTFADYFLDGLIFDWIVQSKIVRSREGALKTQRRVEQIVSLLKGELTKARVRVEELETERRSLIEVA